MISILAFSNPVSITGCNSRNMHSLHSNFNNWHHTKLDLFVDVIVLNGPNETL